MRWRALPFLVLSLGSTACTPDRPPLEDAAGLDVLFDERHGLSGGERVVFHDFDVGEVTSVDVHDARVRARLAIERQVLEQLTEATTFVVEEGDSGLVLEAHVLDPDAPRLREGATVEGSDSALELTLRRAGVSAKKLFEMDPEDPEDEEELERKLEQAKERLGELADESAEKARGAAAELERGIERLTEELERAGKSDEAQNLREKLNELLETLKQKAAR